ncbi:MFS transporter [Allokutzneria sp. A3M-2-11 16]|uniref:MFS transporter n=1 Tax=Allokutzneria sp. A3M-2-11 16 TaxID=2962043 RepID=UPI0020B80979|nr:MFS transporter [Allokutzneria sp. A3M-2-11 16]MCP3803373.1 MFS transporter [Allokutzneria sp. A3M-2-11 16]
MGESLGKNYAKLWAANTVTNIGDGVSIAAGPLLVAAITDNPALVGGAVFCQQLPWLLFSLVSGVYVDRLDRRKLVVLVNLLRGALMGLLALFVATGTVTIPLLYAVLFLLGVGETLADNASLALLPGVVRPDQLDRANARMTAATIAGGNLAGPPLGAYLFVIAAAVPFGFDAATFVIAALLVWRVRLPAPVREESAGRSNSSVRSEIAEGVRWLWGQPVLRLLAQSILLMNLSLSGVMAIMVFFARERLGLGEIGYGLLLTASALGALLGTALIGALRRRFTPASLLHVGLLIETATHLVLALTRSPLVAGATLVVFGVHTAVWGVLIVALRQRLVPEHLRGRVNSVYFLFSIGGSALGALLGGWIAYGWGVTTPFWLACGLMAVVTVLTWRPLTRSMGTLPQTADLVKEH